MRYLALLLLAGCASPRPRCEPVQGYLKYTIEEHDTHCYLYPDRALCVRNLE